jgi:hypothetical protein
VSKNTAIAIVPKNALALITDSPCAACGAVNRWNRTYCERRCTATPSPKQFSDTSTASSPPDPHLHMECRDCGYVILTDVVRPREVAMQRYGGENDGTR